MTSNENFFRGDLSNDQFYPNSQDTSRVIVIVLHFNTERFVPTTGLTVHFQSLEFLANVISNCMETRLDYRNLTQLHIASTALRVTIEKM